MAAGVGKTYRMLQEGRQALDDGRDVVIGYLEPHDRPETAAQAAGMLAVPALELGGDGGPRVRELDVDAVIARAPEIALIDELAHTNATGMRNAKRYEDIEEILVAGIDVTSTVNIQHLESLNDTVAEITGVRVRETFPDRILEDAEVVLVDLSPEALRARITAGKVYRPDRVDTALQNFFQHARLESLRELALGQIAEDIGARRKTAVLDPLATQAVAERLLVLVTPEPRSQRVLRRAWRSAQRLGADVDALWIRTPGRGRAADDEVALAALRRLAVVLGVHFLVEDSDELVETVRRVAAERGSTYVLLGTPDERRIVEVFRGSLVSALIRALPGIDVRVVANRVERPEPHR
jgi:two-component system, OmpR family, sensor histidine kinase KdpD